MHSLSIPSRRHILRGSGVAVAAALLAGHRVLRAQDKARLSFAAVTFSEAGRGERLKAWVGKFNQSQTAAEIQPIAIPFGSFAKTVFTQMGGGAGPDLVRMDLIDYYAAVQARRVLALDDLLKTEDYRFTASDRHMIIGGKRYGVPFEISNYVLLYNPALLKGGRPPADFDEFLASAKAATGNGVYGFAYRATMAEGSGFWQDLCSFVYGFGGRWSDAQGRLTLNDPKVIEGVAAYKKVYDAGVIPKGADAATYRRMFWERKLAMEVDNGGVAGIFSQQAPQLSFAAAPAPFPTRAQGMVLTALTINANTKHKAAAQAFVKWALQPGNQKQLQELLGASSVATVVDRSPEDLASKPWLKVYDEQAPHGIPQVVAGLEAKTPEIQQIVLEQVLKVLQGGMAPKKALDDAQRLVLARVLRK
ncbi:extracellular solute-binding protein [Verminephrobacter eiseniae]|uniref:extracellular solute-binding protein n=1 Tax=Verminephrobacter eiseniae TaxID=364317 RepID=UPI0022385D3A|nr:extracellular solute-binding protein [Verminephrobacter eiseniae]MCW5231309.1 extracellular solute-binding protein [Verminephrobacter eiseniae]MCW5293041.1 extracellular solute-binding protein [Verminephrobacter eiseniae]MCW8184434.1 extracellular solute-binding protein [Verminephrobacter eiseniae]MCW8221442.1 extracellular solute-binding protein [Verminephrobacter eiseniae]MCW8232387.1 extracellular solute-binding protein [Verminephrobacter eiseniae]